MKKVYILFIVLFTHLCEAQEALHRTLVSKRNAVPKKIDGILSTNEWMDASVIDSFTEFRPQPGDLELEGQKTIAYLSYSDEGIYFGGICFETDKNNISSELIGRDGFGNNDFIGLILDTYKDNLNGFEYFVTPLNEQMDAKVSPSVEDSEDFSWNAVWESATSIRDDGWVFELFIPFSAIRFSKKNIQDWGLNVTRRRQKTGEQYMWNPILPTVSGFLNQEGYLTGLQDIKPPLRLQFAPYLSLYSNHFPSVDSKSDWTRQINGGMDVKWGINQAFTLDATLIPDFGQVQSDNQVLNLSPFEVRFNENRPFFTEGTELFNKGNFFYSRRIGGVPYYYYNIQQNIKSNERIVANPYETSLINASKISGRTESGLGIGFLNALTATEYATIENIENRQRRKELTNPLTNYNVLVIDQTLKNNSSFSFVNTSVLRQGQAHEAIVSAVLFDINDKTNTWGGGGKVALSQISGTEHTYGYSQLLYFGKKSGRFNFNLFQELSDTRFTSNDLGYFTNNNYLNHGLWLGYRWVTPGGWYNRININGNINISHLYKTFAQGQPSWQNGELNLNLNGQLKNLWWAGMFISYNPRSNDFYEPRQYGRYFNDGKKIITGLWVETNNNKKYYLSLEAIMGRYINFYNRQGYEMNINQNYRINQKLSFSWAVSAQPKINNIGFSGYNGQESVFAKRDIHTISNTVSVKYSFTNRMGLTARIRHYHSKVNNKEYYTLLTNGQLDHHLDQSFNFNKTADYFNIDMVYSWQFAQGSFINLVWKNAIARQLPIAEGSYFSNLSQLWDENQNNNISFKVIYFLDYQQLKH